ncbi:MAG: DUF3826 domain-containing protein [Tepidisphaeraceae bacterium]
MKRVSTWLVAAFSISMLANGSALQAADPTTAPADDAEAKYTVDINKRADDIIALLGELSPEARNSVRTVITDQYRALRAWQAEHETSLKDLKKKLGDKDAAEQAKTDIDAIMATRKTLHDSYLAKLGQLLSEKQIEAVKDKMTYNKVKVTYDAYCDQVLSLTPEQKAVILKNLVEARELAMDGTSSKEKDEIFGKYKGRINIYLSQQGYNMKAEENAWRERLKQRRAAATTQSSK